MPAIEAAIAKILIDVAVSTGVDVLSKRAANPIIRGASRTYKVLSFISAVDGAYEAIRISAYADAAQLIGQEVFVERGTKPLVEALLRIREANYEIHTRAGEYLLTPEYAEADSELPLGRWLYHNLDFPSEDRDAFGGALAAQTATAVVRSVRARAIAAELAAYPEAGRERGYYKENPTPRIIDRINTELGNLLWLPVPEIGLGMRTVADGAEYRGIFRRNDPEGYGAILSTNGKEYLGQSRWGFPRGYGALKLPDRALYFGKVPQGDHQLGASIPASRDWVYYGEHRGTTPDGYGRRIGLRGGIESVTGFWDNGKLESKLETLAEVHRRIAEGMDNPLIATLQAEYMQRAARGAASIAINDASVVDQLRAWL